MSRKQAEGLVKNVKDPELLRAWAQKLGSDSVTDSESDSVGTDRGSHKLDELVRHEEAF